VLEPDFQTAGKIIPKWTKRSRLGQFLGYSKRHSTTVGLVRNVRTGKISPQFHAVYDDHFSTVNTTFQDPNESLNQAFSSEEWKHILQFVSEKYYPDDAEVPSLDEEWEPEDNDHERGSRKSMERRFRERNPLDHSTHPLEQTVQDPGSTRQDSSTITSDSDMRTEQIESDEITMDPMFMIPDVDTLPADPLPDFLRNTNTKI
jgi:hypothetical protein